MLGSLVALVVLVGLLLWKPRPATPAATGKSLLVYCAAGLKAPVEAAARAYETRYGVPVQLQFGGSGALVSNLKVARSGDLFIAADDSFLHIAKSHQLVAEVLPLARLVPVLVIRKDHVPKPRALVDLESGNFTVAMANPESAAIGKVCKELLIKAGHWTRIQPHIKVFKPTVNDIASDVKLGTVDVGLVWDATANQYPELEAIPVTEFQNASSTVSVAVLSFCEQPAAALRFARFLAARDQGLTKFTQAGFNSVHGDVWAEQPQVVLYSGGVNRVAIEETVRAFEQREGVSVARIYNGCGILTAQIRSGQRPDAYLACDVSFMRNVSEHFSPATNLSETRIVILVKNGNPRGIRDLAGLGAAGLQVGLAHEQQSALGAMTARLLRAQGLFERVQPNVKVQTPTADLLVNQIRTGSLDAVVVFEANTTAVREQLDVVTLSEPDARAVQPFAIGKNSDHVHLMDRLLEALQTATSRQRFEQSGFLWRGASPQP